MLEIFLWAVLFGGLPTVGYYLFQFGRILHDRRRQIRETGNDQEQASEQWKAEVMFMVNVCAWAGFGLVVVHLLETISGPQ